MLFGVTAMENDLIPPGIVSTVRIAIVVVVVVVLIGRRLVGEPIQPARLFLMPPVLLVLGGIDLAHSLEKHLTGPDFGFLVVSGGLALAIGGFRGTTVVLFERGGYLWMRYRLNTLLLWVALTGARFLLSYVGASIGSALAADNSALGMLLGVTLIAEAVIIAVRARAMDVPFAPAEGRGLLVGGLFTSGLLGDRHGGLFRSRRGGRLLRR